MFLNELANISLIIAPFYKSTWLCLKFNGGPSSWESWAEVTLSDELAPRARAATPIGSNEELESEAEKIELPYLIGSAPEPDFPCTTENGFGPWKRPVLPIILAPPI